MIRHATTRLATLAMLAVCVLLTGCADRAMMMSFQDITSEAQRHGWFYGRQYSSISIPGLIAAYEPGCLYSYNPRRGPMSATGITTGEDTLIITKTVDGSGDPATIHEIRLLMDQIKRQTFKVVKMRLEEIKKSFNDQAAEGEKPFAVVSTYQYEDIKSATNDLNALEARLAQKLSIPGVMIFHWSNANAASTSADVADTASTSASSKAASGGYVIIDGLRVSTLYVGEDIRRQWNNVKDIGFWRNWPQVTTMVAQTKNIAYATEMDLEQTFKAELEISPEKAQAIASDWRREVSLVLKTYAARYQHMANSGTIGQEKITIRKKNWNCPASSTQDTAMDGCLQGWATFYQVSTSLKALKKTMGGDHPDPSAAKTPDQQYAIAQ